MIYQADIARLNAIIATQLISPIGFIVFASILLWKKRNFLRVMLAMYYIMLALGYLITGASVLVQNYAIARTIYIIGGYIFMTGNSYLIIISISFRPKFNIFTKRNLILVLGFYYTVSFILLIIIPDGIRYDASTNGTPQYSLAFFIVSSAYLILGVATPLIILFKQVMGQIQDSILHKRLKRFFIAAIIIIFSNTGTVIYNTWVENTVFRGIWIIYAAIGIPLTLVLVYFAIGREIKYQKKEVI